MTSPNKTTELKLSAPGNCDQVLVRLGDSKELSNALLRAPAEGRVEILDNGCFTIVWSQAPEAGTPCHVDVTSQVELQTEVNAEWSNSLSVIITHVPIQSDWSQIYDGRRDLAINNPRQAMMFEIDRQTQPRLLEHNPDIEEVEKRFRIHTVDALVKELRDRLENRWNGRPCRPLAFRHRVAFISSLFHDATLALGVGPDWGEVGRAFRMFAAGHLREVVYVERPKRAKRIPLLVTEPNSYFTFLFAEFGFEALDRGLDAEMWQALLPDFIKMQAYYLERLQGIQCVTQYQFPAKILTPAECEAIDQRFAPNPTRETLEKWMFQNLRRAGKCFVQ